MEQLAQEGVIQIFRELGAGMESVIVGAVGVLQVRGIGTALEKRITNVEVRSKDCPIQLSVG